MYTSRKNIVNEDWGQRKRGLRAIASNIFKYATVSDVGYTYISTRCKFDERFKNQYFAVKSITNSFAIFGRLRKIFWVSQSLKYLLLISTSFRFKLRGVFWCHFWEVQKHLHHFEKYKNNFVTCYERYLYMPGSQRATDCGAIANIKLYMQSLFLELDEKQNFSTSIIIHL